MTCAQDQSKIENKHLIEYLDCTMCQNKVEYESILCNLCQCWIHPQCANLKINDILKMGEIMEIGSVHRVHPQCSLFPRINMKPNQTIYIKKMMNF